MVGSSQCSQCDHGLMRLVPRCMPLEIDVRRGQLGRVEDNKTRVASSELGSVTVPNGLSESRAYVARE